MEDIKEYKVYSSRWLMLGLFCFLNFANAMLWVTFAPITDLTSIYFNNINLTAVNMLALVFQIGYLPGTLLGVICTKKYGIRNTLLIGGLLDLLGSLIRLLGTLLQNSISNTLCYSIVMLGQILGSLAQPIFVNLPAAIASDWFSINERDVATTIAALFNPLGSAIGQVIPTIIVYEEINESNNTSTIKGMNTLMIVEAIICLFSLLTGYLWFKSKPPTPPSRSALIKDNIQSNVDNLSDNEINDVLINNDLSNVSSHRSFEHSIYGDNQLSHFGLSKQDIHYVRQNLKVLFNNKDYILLLMAFSVALGLFNAFLTLIYQIIEPHGYSNDDAGTFAAILILFGLIGAGITSVILDSTHMYREVLRYGFLSVLFTMIFFMCMLYSNNFIILCVAFAILGLFMLPLLPAVVENCAEITYPIQEDLPLGLLMIGGNLIGIPFVIILQFLLKEKPFGPAPLLPSNIFIILLILIAILMLTNYQGEYKRLKYDKNIKVSIDHTYNGDSDNNNNNNNNLHNSLLNSNGNVTDPLLTRITSNSALDNQYGLNTSTSAIDTNLLRNSRTTLVTNI